MPATPNTPGRDVHVRAAAVGEAAPRDRFGQRCRDLAPRLARDLGLSELQAAGLLGNLAHETGGFVHLQEIRPVVAGSRGGWGIAQWTGPRRRAMEAWCRARGLDPASDEANDGYLVEELRGPESAALLALRRAATLEAATETVCLLFERPGVVALDSRVAWARRALAALRAPAPRPPEPEAPESEPLKPEPLKPEPPEHGPPPSPAPRRAAGRRARRRTRSGPGPRRR